MSHHNEEPCTYCGVADRVFRRVPVTIAPSTDDPDTPMLLCWICIGKYVGYEKGGVRHVAIAIEGDRPVMPPNTPLEVVGGDEPLWPLKRPMPRKGGESK